ncbi:MAG TPA: ABC transporter ATP-binding protein [Bacillota bacterium]|jgi:ABC-type multidrug transport system ATPase subunit|nr:ABC transporter ATP-binding protein [Bacillota bacterium]HOL08832.1 ABC transporter ATP-binding protein [Bacillota bacterium]HPO98462.1 ABC transporter ATP-binding protein [Bacillota bacterium]
MSIISVENLTKEFGTRKAVDNISFNLAKGEILGLLGPNGAGKTTTMRMLMGLSKPSSGNIRLFGLDLNKNLKKIHPRIGVAFEKPNLFENLSGYQNLAIYCKLYQKPTSAIKPLLERMELADRANDPVKVYSKGMKQRILILRALIHEPELLFLDEPASGLDPVSSRIIWDYLKEQQQKGISIVLTSHDMEEVDELCNRIGFINHGRLIALAEPYVLKEKYGEKTLKVVYQDSSSIKEEVLSPTPEHFQYLQTLYQKKRVLSVHSQEATLGDIFRILSSQEN